jgi:RNA polymerase sigma factor (sigma-70 family)
MAEKVPFDFNGTLRRLSGGEEVAQIAFKELHDYLSPNIYVSARKFMKSQVLAEDLVQEVFTAVWEKRKQLTGVLNFEFYLYGMTKRMAYDLTRRSVNAEIIKRKHLEQMKSKEDPFKEILLEEMDEMVKRLPSPRKEIFQLSKVEGVEGKVIAERFNMSVNAVHHHVGRAMKFLSKMKHNGTTFLLITISLIQRLTGL